MAVRRRDPRSPRAAGAVRSAQPLRSIDRGRRRWALARERSSMSTRNLDALFAPGAIAFVGANDRPGSVGAVVTRNLREAAFPGRLMLVSPFEAEIQGLPA